MKPPILLIFFLLVPSKAAAIVSHEYPAIYTHELGRIFFLIACLFILYAIIRNHLHREQGWRYIVAAVITFIVWDLTVAFTHLAELRMIGDTDGWDYLKQLVVVEGKDYLFYIGRFDYVFLDLGMFFFYVGLREFLEKEEEPKAAAMVLLPFLPIIISDVAGALVMIALSLSCLNVSVKLYRRSRENALWHYMIWLSSSFVMYSISRAVSHIAKPLLVSTGNLDIWKYVEPVSGSINSFTFFLVGSVSLFFIGIYNLYLKMSRDEQQIGMINAKYRRIVDTANEGILVLGPDTMINFVNTRMAGMLGYSVEEMLGRPVTDFMFEEDAPDHLRKMENRRLGLSEHYERRFRCKAGQTVWTLASATPIFDDAHHFNGAFGMFTDITERKWAEESQRRLNRELRALRSCSQLLMRAEDEQTLLSGICRIICDEGGYRMAWVGYAECDNAKTVRPVAWGGVEDGYLETADITWADTDRGCGPTGTAIRSGESICIQDFATDSHATPWRNDALLRGYRSSIALPLKDESANTFGALNIYSMEPNAFTPDEKRLLEELAADLAFGITVLRTRIELRQTEEDRLVERRKAEEALLLSQKRLDAVRRIGVMASSTLNLDEVLNHILAGTLEATGASVGMIFLKDTETGCLKRGASIGLSEAFVAAYRDQLIKPGEGLSGRIMQTGEVIYIAQDSSHDPRIARAVVEAEGLNTFIGVPVRAGAEIVGVMNILTRSPNVLSEQETALVDAIGTHVGFTLRNAQLFTEWKKLGEQLRQSQKMEAIGHLAGGIAHDFNNILTAIIGFGMLLKDRISTDNVLRDYINQILAAAGRAADLTHSLLAFSRKQIMELRPVNINDIIVGMQKILNRIIGEDIHFTVKTTAHDLIVKADRSQIEQVMMNLATNARDAMPHGGSLTVTTEEVEIDELFMRMHQIGEAGRYALISISDTGLGMDEETREHIFEPFFTTKEVGKGTGLGLAMVYGTIKQHDGFIKVYSEPGEGTAFRIYLPLVKSDLHKDEMSVRALVHGKETVLLVEDDEAVRKVTKAMLEALGYTVMEVVDGRQAVKLFAENKEDIQLVISDIIMPGLSGKEVYNSLKQIRPEVKVLFISGYSADVLVKKGIMDEGINFISKPLRLDAFSRKLREVLDR